MYFSVHFQRNLWSLILCILTSINPRIAGLKELNDFLFGIQNMECFFIMIFDMSLTYLSSVILQKKFPNPMLKAKNFISSSFFPEWLTSKHLTQTSKLVTFQDSTIPICGLHHNHVATSLSSN